MLLKIDIYSQRDELGRFADLPHHFPPRMDDPVHINGENYKVHGIVYEKVDGMNEAIAVLVLPVKKD